MRRRVTGNDEAALARWNGKAAQQSIAELRAEYVTAMKLATLSYEMLAPAFRNKIRPLKLPRPVVPVVPELGCVEIPHADAKGARQRMQENLFHADAILLRCIRMVRSPSESQVDTPVVGRASQ